MYGNVCTEQDDIVSAYIVVRSILSFAPAYNNPPPLLTPTASVWGRYVSTLCEHLSIVV